MYDINHFVGGDLALSPSGDLSIVTSDTMSQQRILRRLLTNPPIYDDTGNVQTTGDYMWHQSYGGGVGRQIGANVDMNEIVALIRGQMLLEDSVSQIPEPTIIVTPIDVGVSVDIQYNNAQTGAQKFLSFDVSV